MPGVLAGARRVLVVRLDNVGDVVLCTPALRALRRALPAAHLTLLASPAGAALAPLLDDVDEVRAVRALWQDASGRLPFDPARERALIADLAAGGFDAALVLTSFSQSPHAAAYACYLAGIPIRAGIAADFGGAVLSHPVTPPPDGTHQADRALHLLAALGVADDDGGRLGLGLPVEALARAVEVLGDAAPGYAVVAPGASCPARRYPAGRFAAVVAGLAERGRDVVVVGSAAEASLAGAVAGAHPHVRSLAGRTDVPALAAVIAGAGLVVTNNSGPLHLADAYARPTVALFAGTERESEYAPRSAPLRLLRRPTPCSPCRAFDCPPPGGVPVPPAPLACLDLSPDTVLRAARELVG